MSNTVTIREHKAWDFRSELTESDIQDLRNIESSAFTIGHDSLKVHNHVGCFATSSGKVIEVLPKFDLSQDGADQDDATRRVLLSMLRHWRNRGFETLAHSEIRAISNFPMLDAFIYLFLNQVRDLVRNGLARKYVEVEENLASMRGRLLFREHLKENLTNQSRFYVSHDEFSDDRPANRLIHKTLQILKARVGTIASRQLFDEITAAFAEVPASNNIHADWEAHHLDRTMHRYEPVMRWIQLFLFNKGIATYSGQYENVSLLFPMEQIFEDFVAHSFRKYQQQYVVQTQRPTKYLAKSANKDVFQMRPDICLKSGNSVRYILDAKWKRIDERSADKKRAIIQSDMYQLFAYATHYHCSRVALIYPATSEFSAPLSFQFNYENYELLCLPFDSSAPQESVATAMHALSNNMQSQ